MTVGRSKDAEDVPCRRIGNRNGREAGRRGGSAGKQGGIGMYDESCLNAFLEQQGKLFREPVAGTPEEAEEFLEDCMAVICGNLREVREYFDEEGMDITGMSDEELGEAEEVFALPDGRYLIVES
jgi:hypothetical protein